MDKKTKRQGDNMYLSIQNTDEIYPDFQFDPVFY
jgi:hypothetical protein